jgi:hypothetical protein
MIRHGIVSGFVSLHKPVDLNAIAKLPDTEGDNRLRETEDRADLQGTDGFV